MTSGRQKQKTQLIDLAARAWERWRASRTWPSQSAWTASEINKSRTHQAPITGKWVTRNRAQIEAEVSRRSATCAGSVNFVRGTHARI